jgi:hypothetical protein
MKIREQISTANITRREVVIGSASLAALATLAPAARAAVPWRKSGRQGRPDLRGPAHHDQNAG